MMLRKCVSFLTILVFNILITSFLYSEIASEIESERVAYNEYIGHVSELNRAFAEQMEKELGLRCRGPRGMMHGTIEELGMDFQAERRATIDEARALQLLVMNKFVQAINANEKIQPFLETRPFTLEQVQVFIVFQGVNGLHADGSIYRVFNTPGNATPPNQNHIFYYTWDPFECDSNEVLDESYEEALKQNAISSLKDLAVAHEVEKEMEIDRLFYEFREQMDKEHQLECWGIGGKMTGNIDDISAKFVAVRRATQKEARALILSITQSLLEAVNGSQQIKPYLKEAPFPLDRLRLRLCFKRSSYGTYMDGSMESVTLVNGQLTYFQEIPVKKGEMPSGRFIEVPIYATESYEEAVEKASAPQSFFQKLFSS